MNRVVKCKNNQCEQYFMLTKENTKCPFCYTEYGEDEKTEEKKEAKKTKKESFRIWKDL